ncbi:KR-domain-containing protein, partial [Colletotrichum caudatum]
DVARAAEEAGPHLKGIFQLSMVLRDEAFPRMSLEDWTPVVEPKTKSTWNLHNAALKAGVELDIFVLFSSLSGILGQPGQANFSGSNTFLDAFVQYRKILALKASAINIGVVMDIGAAALDKALMERTKAARARGVMEQELLEAISAAILSDKESSTVPAGTSFIDQHTHLHDRSRNDDFARSPREPRILPQRQKIGHLPQFRQLLFIFG